MQKCVCPVSEHVASFDDKSKKRVREIRERQRDRRMDGWTDGELEFRERETETPRVHSIQVNMSAFSRCVS